MANNDLEDLGLAEPLDRKKVLAYMRKFRIMPYWKEDRGFFFRPHVSREAKRQLQQFLHLRGKEDVQRLRRELRQEVVIEQPVSSPANSQTDLEEDEVQREIEERVKARKRTRGPYRKSAPIF